MPLCGDATDIQLCLCNVTLYKSSFQQVLLFNFMMLTNERVGSESVECALRDL